MASLMMQIGAAVPSSPMELVTQSSGETKVVLIILAILSILSWAVMIAKWVEFNRAEKAGREFMDKFERTHTLDEAADVAGGRRRARRNAS